jgi:hypothetical protein
MLLAVRKPLLMEQERSRGTPQRSRKQIRRSNGKLGSRVAEFSSDAIRTGSKSGSRAQAIRPWVEVVEPKELRHEVAGLLASALHLSSEKATAGATPSIGEL